MWYLIGKVDSKEDAMKIGGSDLLLIGNGTTPVLSRYNYVVVLFDHGLTIVKCGTQNLDIRSLYL